MNDQASLPNESSLLPGAAADGATASGAGRPAIAEPDVLILLAVYNGADHLDEQLASIAAQTHPRWRVHASDDASGDGSAALLQNFADKGLPLTLAQGPCKGGSENFLSLVRAIPPQERGASWMAFCDQDDVWMPQRLSQGIAALARLPADEPALFCSATLITDYDLTTARPSPPRPKPPGFRNALVQNIASGNTILLNAAAARLVCEAADEIDRVVVHDWWVYQLVSGAGGTIVHDDTPLLYYRQHAENQIGANDTTRAQLKRIKMLLDGHFRDWNDINIAALRASADRLTPENRTLLEEFARMRDAPLPVRLRDFLRLGLYRQNLAGTLALWLSVLLRRL